MSALDPRLQDYRAVWKGKPVLRAIYRDYYRRISEACRPGNVLEIGGGSGDLKQFAPRVVSTDILPAPWLDAVADAEALPFADRSFDNIAMIDVLHHIGAPRRFLAEAQRILRPGGRIVLVEPAITPLSWVVYKLFHHEPVMMSQDPLGEAERAPSRDPYDANSAIPTLLLRRHRGRMARHFPGLTIRRVELFSLLAYPLSGGFRSWSLLPVSLVEPLLRLEGAVSAAVGRFMAFRLFAVLERS